MVDPGGNWLRITSGGPEEEGSGPFERVLLNAARQGDAHGDESAAIAVLESGLIRHADTSEAERVPVYVYLAELLIRTGDHPRATEVLDKLRGLDLDEATAPEVAELVSGVEPGPR